MKNVAGIMFLLLLSFAFTADAPPPQQWYVFFHVGEILRQNNQLLQDHKLIPSNERLTYTSKTDLVYVGIPGVGEVQLGPSVHAESRANAWVELLQNATRTNIKRGKLENMGTNDIIADELLPDRQFGDKLLIQGRTPFLFNEIDYPDTTGFFLQIAHQGTDPEIVPLKTKKDTLLLFAIDFSQQGAVYSVGYRHDRISDEIAQFHTYADTDGKMEEIIHGVLQMSRQMYPNEDAKGLRNRCYYNVYKILGKPSLINFDSSFSNEFQLFNPAKQ